MSMTCTPARPLSWRGWALLLLAAGAALMPGVARAAPSPGEHVGSAVDWLMGLGTVVSLGLAVLGGWYGLREKRRNAAEHEAAPLKALQAQAGRHAAALGLREDDTPLRERVKNLEAGNAALRQEMATLRAVNERIDEQVTSLLTRLGSL